MPELTLEDYLVNLRDPDPDVRRNAAWVLGRSRDFRILEPLIAALPDPDRDVRLRVAESLGNLRDPAAVDPLLAALAAETEADIQAGLIVSLGRQGDARAVDALLTALHDPSPVVRAAAAAAFHDLPDERAVAALVEQVAQDTDENARYQATRTLAHLGGTATLDAIASALPATPDPDARIRLIEILGQLRDTRAAAVLRPLLDDPDEAVSATAHWALGQIVSDG